MIRYTLILGSVLFSAMVNAQVSFQEAQKVFNSLLKTTKQSVALHKSNSGELNAFTDFKGVTITTAMLKFLDNDNELAMVLGHELGHWVNKDIYKPYGTQAMELRADQYGYKMAKRLGYSHPENLFLRFQKALGDAGDDEHPAWSVRYNSLPHNLSYYIAM